MPVINVDIISFTGIPAINPATTADIKRARRTFILHKHKTQSSITETNIGFVKICQSIIFSLSNSLIGLNNIINIFTNPNIYSIINKKLHVAIINKKLQVGLGVKK